MLRSTNSPFAVKLAVAILVFAAHASVIGALLAAPADQPAAQRARTAWLTVSSEEQFAPPPAAGSWTLNRCERSYVGFGLRHDAWNRVTELAPGYPAAGGLLLGDLVLNMPALGEVPLGKNYAFNVQRAGSIRVVLIRASTICLERAAAAAPIYPRED